MLTLLKKFFSVPDFQDEDKQRIANLLSLMLHVLMSLVVGLFVVLNLASVSAFWGDLVNVLILGSVLFTTLGMRFLLLRGRLYLASTLLSLMLWAGTTAAIVINTGIRNSSTSAYLLCITVAGLLLGGRSALTLTGLSVAAVFTVYYIEVNHWIVYEPVSELPEAFDLIAYVAIFALGGLLLRYAADYLTRSLALAHRNERAQIQANQELTELHDSLEAQVAERTQDLELRARYLEAASQISRVASSTLDVDVLTERVVTLVREWFDLYYVGLFFVSDVETASGGRWATLQAGTGPAGQVLRARGHTVPIDASSLVGESLAGDRERVVQGDIPLAAQLATAELPETRAEAVLPLRSRGRVIGALDLHGNRPDPFGPLAMASLQNIADQVATALDNARLFAESQAALEAERRAYGQISRDAWQQLLRAGAVPGYALTGARVRPIGAEWTPEMAAAVREERSIVAEDQAKLTLALPIKARGQTIGVLDLRKDDAQGTWSTEEVQLAEALTDQLSIALENARLYQDTQRRVAREQVISEVGGRIRETLHMETMLRTATEQMCQVLGLEDLVVRLTTAPEEK